MDPEAFLDMANQVIKLKMFPYFDIAHCVLVAAHVRDDLGTGAQAFSRKHPLSCWLSTMLSVFASSMLCNGLLGEPILAPLKNTPQVVVATIVWCKKVYDGVTHAGKLYPNAYLIMILIGTFKGNGAEFTKLFERLIRGVWTPTAMEFMQPSFPTKASMVASIIFVLDKKTDLISAPHALVYFGIVIFFVYFKLSSILLGIHDPFVPFENLFCALFLGGIWDSLARLFGRGQAKDEKADAKKTN
ncbi:T38BA protein, partial [Acromyrmex charruanus]